MKSHATAYKGSPSPMESARNLTLKAEDQREADFLGALNSYLMMPRLLTEKQMKLLESFSRIMMLVFKVHRKQTKKKGGSTK